MKKWEIEKAVEPEMRKTGKMKAQAKPISGKSGKQGSIRSGRGKR